MCANSDKPALTQSLGPRMLLFLPAFLCFLYLVSACQSSKSDASSQCLVVADSIGAESGSIAFARVPSFCVTERDQIVILDSGNSFLHIFTSEGEPLSRIDISGGGPGEFYSANCVTPAYGGGVWVSSFYDHKVALFNDTLGLEMELVLNNPEYCAPLEIFALETGGLLGRFLASSMDSSGMALAVLDYDGSLSSVVMRKLLPFDPTGGAQIETDMVAAIGPDSLIYVAPRREQQYSVFVYNTEGSLIRRISLPGVGMQAKPAAVVERERESALRNWIVATGSSDGFAYEPSTLYDMISYMGVDSLGRLWVLRGDYVNPVFDVFGRGGEREFTCSVRLPRWQTCDRWLFYVGRGGFLAVPYNSEQYPLVYTLNLEATQM